MRSIGRVRGERGDHTPRCDQDVERLQRLPVNRFCHRRPLSRTSEPQQLGLGRSASMIACCGCFLPGDRSRTRAPTTIAVTFVVKLGGVAMAGAPWIVPEELWERIEASPPNKQRRFPLSGPQAVTRQAGAQGILIVLHTGIAWRHLPASARLRLGFDLLPASGPVETGQRLGAAARTTNTPSSTTSPIPRSPPPSPTPWTDRPDPGTRPPTPAGAEPHRATH